MHLGDQRTPSGTWWPAVGPELGRLRDGWKMLASIHHVDHGEVFDQLACVTARLSLAHLVCLKINVNKLPMCAEQGGLTRQSHF